MVRGACRRRPTRRPTTANLLSNPLAAALGVGLDGLVGEPPARLHPVRSFGAVMHEVEATLYRDNRSAGVAHSAVGTGLGLASGVVVGSTAAATALAVAGRALRAVAAAIGAALDQSDLDGARELLPSLVGRDVTGLDASEMARAVVEAVAENTVDAVVAPALWASLCGAPGALGYRAVNTMDAMVGHKSDRYRRYGWASARLDDVAAFVPARVTVALVVLARPRALRAVWRAVRTQAPLHPSPNAGVAEAAFAAALGIRLGGVNRYGTDSERRPVLGTGRRAEPGDIGRAVELCHDVCTGLVVVLCVVGVVTTARRGARLGRRR